MGSVNGGVAALRAAALGDAVVVFVTARWTDPGAADMSVAAQPGSCGRIRARRAMQITPPPRVSETSIDLGVVPLDAAIGDAVG